MQRSVYQLKMQSSTNACAMYSLFIILCVISCIAVTVTDASSVVVDSPFGRIQGVKKTDETTGQSYVSFRGIPYAKPPLGDLRFRKPEPHPKLGGVFDATDKEKKIMCPHPDILTYGEIGFTEDCLILNILSREISPSDDSLKKVMFFIHGGGFFVGTAEFYQAKSFVLSQDVIVVTINYRLGILGFMSTEDEASPGNYGLWDQHLALKWVKDNIRAFGGDPNDVTISGESAGGASVGYQMISPHTKGLFTKAYPQSGTASSTFARSINAQSHTLTIAKSAGCWDKGVDYKLSVQESHSVVTCLREAPVSSFTSYSAFTFAATPFTPVVDGDFVPDLPAALLQDEEYLDSIGFFDRSYLIALDNIEHGVMENFMTTTKTIIFSNNQTSQEEKDSAWQQLLTTGKDLYMLSRLGEKGSADEKIVGKIDEFYNRRYIGLKPFIEMMTDLSFFIPSLDYLRAASMRKSCHAYFLYFDYFPQTMKGHLRGTPHGLDLIYWFDFELDLLEKLLQTGIQGEMTQEDLKLKVVFSSLIGEFMRSGNPGKALKNVLPSGWPKYDITNSYYLNFNSDPWVSSFLQKDKQDFWFKTIPEMLKKEIKQHTHSEL